MVHHRMHFPSTYTPANMWSTRCIKKIVEGQSNLQQEAVLSDTSDAINKIRIEGQK